MLARSAATRCLDPYRAGLELAEGVRAIEPEIIFLFSSIHYEGNPELPAGLFDALGHAPVVIGATGDGFYETDATAEIGASALGLNSAGKVRWHLAAADGAAQDIAGACERCAAALHAAAGAQPLSLCLVFADLHADAAALADSLARTIEAPTVGGLAGDDYRLQRGFVYANREVLRDGLAMLAVTGDLRFAIHLAGDFTPVGLPGVVTEAVGTRLLRIDDKPAAEFITRQHGKPLSAADLGISAFLLAQREAPGLSQARTIRQVNPADGSVTLFGAVQPEQRIRFCRVSPETIGRDVRKIGAVLCQEKECPAALLVISCAGRKRILGDEHIEDEVAVARLSCEHKLPLAGFPSFGEIAPACAAASDARAHFHNMTYILLVFET